MKTESRSVTKTYTIWTCLNDKHHHKTQAVAQACINRKLERTTGRSPNVWSVDKQEELIALRDSGMTFKAIGMTYGIGGQQASSNYWRFVRLKSKRETTFSDSHVKKFHQANLLRQPIDTLDFTMRTRNCVINACWDWEVTKYGDVVYVEHLIQLTELQLLKTPNLGRKSLSEIQQVLDSYGLSLRQ